MLFVRLSGPTQRLNEMLTRIMCEELVHPEMAGEFLTSADGYVAFTDPCPFDDPLHEIEAIAGAAGDAIDPAALTNVFGTDRPMAYSYMKKLIGYVADTDFDDSDINVYLSGLKPRTDALSGMRLELEEKERYLTHRVETLRHFTHLGTDAASLRSALAAHADAGTVVHFGCLPRDAIMKLYRYSAGSFLQFKIFSSDDQRYWGYYTAPEDRDAEAAGIMESLFFEELELSDRETDVQAQLEQAMAELDTIKARNQEIAAFWQENAERLTDAYSTLLDLRQIWAMRGYAVKRDEQFHFIFWIPQKRKHAIKKLISNMTDVEFAFRQPEAVAAVQSLSEPFPFEADIRDIEHLAHQSGFELSEARLHNVLGTRRELTRDYMDAVADYITGGTGGHSAVIPPALRGQIYAHSRTRLEIKQNESSIRKQINRLKHFTSLTVPIEQLAGAKYMNVHFGRLSTPTARKLRDEKPDFPLYFEITDSDDSNSWCVYLVPEENQPQADVFFNANLFKEYVFDYDSGTPTEILASLHARLDELDRQKTELNRFWQDNLELIELSYAILLDLRALWARRNEITRQDGKYRFAGRMSRPDRQKYETLYNAFGGFASDESAGAARKAPEPPTKLKNLRIFRPFEFFVEMYGMPRYGSMDITAFVAVTYTVLFGIMFGDLGQGAVLVIGGLILWLKKKSRLARAIIPCGCASMVAGCVFGSVFGYEDLLDPVYHSLGLAGKPVEVMESINGILVFAIGIGVSLVVISILVNIIGHLRQKRFGAALFDTNGLAGLTLYVFGVLLVYGFMAGTQVVPSAVAFPIMGVCAVILFLKEKLIAWVDKTEHGARQSVADFIMQNFFELIEYILSYFSNTVSFLRVGAFVLVHAGMMMVVFSLAGESRNIFVVILGNVLIIALEGLLSGIQALRLEFYEMFSRCYEGGGKPFRSFDAIMRQNAEQ